MDKETKEKLIIELNHLLELLENDAEEKRIFLLTFLDIVEEMHLNHQRNTNSTTKIPIIIPIIIIPQKLAPSQ